MRRPILALSLALVLSASVAVAARAAVHNYEGWSWPMCVEHDYEYIGGANSMTGNRVYRPTPQLFALWYQYGGGQNQYAEDSNDNPFWHQQSGGYTYAYGVDYGASTTWCNTTFQYLT